MYNSFQSNSSGIRTAHSARTYHRTKLRKEGKQKQQNEKKAESKQREREQKVKRKRKTKCQQQQHCSKKVLKETYTRV